jgi:hypothetical protein
MPKLTMLVTGVEPTEYLDAQLRDLEAVMTEAEKDIGQVKGWNVKGVEPGGDDVFIARIAADMAPDNIEGLLFKPVEVDARSVSGRAFIRSGQAQGSVTSDTITFAAVAITPVDMSVIMQEQQRRADQAKASTQARTIRRDYIKRLRTQIEDRLKGGTPEVASANGAKAGK